MHLEALRHHRADLFLQFATWEAKAVCKVHDRMFVVQNGKPRFVKFRQKFSRRSKAAGRNRRAVLCPGDHARRPQGHQRRGRGREARSSQRETRPEVSARSQAHRPQGREASGRRHGAAGRDEARARDRPAGCARRSDARRARQGDRLAAAHDPRRPDRPAQARLPDRKGPRR